MPPRPKSLPPDMQTGTTRYDFGGVRMSCVDMPGALDALFDFAAKGHGGHIACTCTHGIVESQRDEQLRQILNRSLLTLPDGMPTVWVGRLKGMPVRRVTAPDFLEAVMRDARAQKLRHYFYGAAPRTLERIVERAKRAVGDDAVVGSYSPPLRPAGAPEHADVIDRMVVARPHLIWVGLGLPKQEYWMARYAPSFPHAVMIGVGAAFDWFAGVQPRAPQWLQLLGLEWLHRVASEPKRLWPRYREVVPRALALMGREFLPRVASRRHSRTT
jgi:N-acetylglucosaminyldiphosphoundecaprenol N-acetyl-beta-D-mannosaminyltransferase